ncbi:zinc finger and SCAN domain-containing protein 2-like [Solea solea]|uniref:zinc finger and SCAN domain-containing protein 2-like n=1 Tax=Solea solea TaxID=90069 RepID=UPI00272BD845|nr:zinc finger and SCAN domain-containing protein 2-like [Solea solea]
MSSLLYLRDVIHGRLTAAAEDIFTHVERIVVEYEEEVDRQRKQLAIVCKRKVKLQRKGLPQQKVNEEEEEGQTKQQLCNQERNPFLDQEEPESLRIKEEEEADTFMLTPDYDESDHMEPEPDTDHQLLSTVAESQDQTEINPGEEHVALYEEEVDQRRQLEILWKPEVQLQQIELQQHHEEKVLTEQEGNSNVDQEEPESLQIKEEEEICTSQEQPELKQEADTFMLTPDNEESDHMEPEPDTDHQLLSPSAESQDQTVHTKNITGEKPHMCAICKKCFAGKGTLINHQRTHTGEKPYYCETCGKCFSVRSTLSRHKNIHTHVKPHMCNVCKKCFRYIRNLIDHKRIHTGEKPYSCGTCGKSFRQNSHLMNHTRTHTGEKPHVCNICKRRFARKDTLLKHENSHR